jgi:hypothetical protein
MAAARLNFMWEVLCGWREKNDILQNCRNHLRKEKWVMSRKDVLKNVSYRGLHIWIMKAVRRKSEGTVRL